MICQAPCQLLMGPKVVYRAAHPVVPISFILLHRFLLHQQPSSEANLEVALILLALGDGSLILEFFY